MRAVKKTTSSPDSSNPVLADVVGKSYDTVVLGFDKNGNLAFLKSYHFPNQRDEAEADLRTVIDSGMGWQMCEIGHLGLKN